MRDEGGFTLVELLLAMVLGIGVLMGTLTLIETSMSSSARVVSRVDANQRARPVMQRIMDQLHSSCVGANVTPIRAGSTGTSVSFLHQSGEAVNPTPDRVVISLDGDNLTQSVYPATGGTAPNWTFSSTPSSTRQLLTNVGPAVVGGTQPALFQYFAYSSDNLSTQLPTPLSTADAARAVEVRVAFATFPGQSSTADAHSEITLTDSAVLRLSPAIQIVDPPNLPCA